MHIGHVYFCCYDVYILTNMYGVVHSIRQLRWIKHILRHNMQSAAHMPPLSSVVYLDQFVFLY
jgi:hypothetical protein